MKQQYWLIDGAKAEKLLGFTPKIILKNGLKETYRWYINQGWL
jgi:nucleoside-diphosphate-sugar epimerase